ncbi:hypothetical protein ACS0TY_006099 [Phlomoides rotata]
MRIHLRVHFFRLTSGFVGDFALQDPAHEGCGFEFTDLKLSIQARVLKFPLFAEIDRNDIINRSNRYELTNSRCSCIPVATVSFGRRAYVIARHMIL